MRLVWRWDVDGTIEIVQDGRSEKVDGENYVMMRGNASELISIVTYSGRIVIRLLRVCCVRMIIGDVVLIIHGCSQ